MPASISASLSTQRLFTICATVQIICGFLVSNLIAFIVFDGQQTAGIIIRIGSVRLLF
jgi:hypothetical protein